MERNLRYLACLRLSADSDESTSITWQRDVIRHHVAAPQRSGVLVGEAEDTDVSGSISPFKRPKLGKWLTKRADEFDVIIAAKMDRLTRRAMHFHELSQWARENGKFIVCVEEGFDLSTPHGKIVAGVMAVFAEGEWDVIQARIINGVQKRLDNLSWLVGAPPTGYQIKTVEGGKRKILTRDESFWGNIEEVKTRVREKRQSTHRIARDYNQRGILTWSDHLRVLKGEEPKGIQWQATIINKMIRSPWFAGIYTYKGEAVLDDNGDPVILPEEPHATMDEWLELVDLIAPAPKPEGAKETRSGAASLLGGIAMDGNCSVPVTSLKGSGHTRKDNTKVPGHRYYRCNNKFKGGNCTEGLYVRADFLDALVDEKIQETIGQWDMYERAGTGPSQARELQSAQARLERLEADFLAGEYDGEGQEESYKRMHKSLSGKVALLAKQEEERTHPALRATGKKYGEVWAAKDQEDRREFLRTYGVKIWVWNKGANESEPGMVMDLGDIQTMAQELSIKLPGKGKMTRQLISHNVTEEQRFMVL